jgi:hypothetical protein
MSQAPNHLETAKDFKLPEMAGFREFEALKRAENAPRQ